MKALFAFVGVVALAAATHTTSGPKADDLTRLINGYRSWTRVTPKPVVMDPSLALSCIGPMDSAAVDTHAHELGKPPARGWFGGFHVFHVYVNSIGSAAMATKGAPDFPVGSVIVKEKFLANQFKKDDTKTLPTPELLTLMVKGQPGSNPGVGDWKFFVVKGTTGAVEAGSVAHCENCHQSQSKKGYVFRSYDGPTLSATYRY